MTDATARLLPWSSADGKPCFVVGDGTGPVSRIADSIEAAQLDSAAELIDESRRVLAGRAWTSGELQLLTVELTDSLDEVHRVARSRGARLPKPSPAAVVHVPAGEAVKPCPFPCEVCRRKGR
ncbi:hypothetical protein [Streptomyces sp. CT34]|uniref:hypothetical protein n=1 Tax=Streptomyces sp. CT34 TaxID=1553907 RepID=UPI001F520E2F|nr:hypothetical protein [Streptomyces sp. CT34]